MDVPLLTVVCDRCGCVVALTDVHNQRCLPDPPPEDPEPEP